MMLKLLLAPVVILMMLLDRAAGGPDLKNYTKRELRLMTLEIKLRSLNPWTRTGKRAKRIAEELLAELKPGPRSTGGDETYIDSIEEWLNS